MSKLKVLIREARPIDGTATAAVTAREVATLAKLGLLNAVERAALELEAIALQENTQTQRLGTRGHNRNRRVHRTFSPVHRHRKFSAVLGTMSENSSMTTRDAGAPPMLKSRYTFGRLLLSGIVEEGAVASGMCSPTMKGFTAASPYFFSNAAHTDTPRFAHIFGTIATRPASVAS